MQLAEGLAKLSLTALFQGRQRSLHVLQHSAQGSKLLPCPCSTAKREGSSAAAVDAQP